MDKDQEDGEHKALIKNRLFLVAGATRNKDCDIGKDMEFLPLEIIYEIVTLSPEVWRDAVMSIPIVSRCIDVSRVKRKFLKEEIIVKGGYHIVCYKLLGKLHRDDGPALLREGYGKSVEVWYRHGKKHRDNWPAKIVRKGGYFSEKWYRHGKLHREDGPAYTLIASADDVHKFSYIWEYGKSLFFERKLEGYTRLSFRDIPKDKFYFYEEEWRIDGEEKRDDGGPLFLKLSNGYIQRNHYEILGKKDYRRHDNYIHVKFSDRSYIINCDRRGLRDTTITYTKIWQENGKERTVTYKVLGEVQSL